MDEWWKRHKDVDMGDYDRRGFEDRTGCIPLLLNKCVVNGKINLDVQEVHDICGKAVHFVTDIRDATTGKEHIWQRYVRFNRQDVTDFADIATTLRLAVLTRFYPLNGPRTSDWSTIGIFTRKTGVESTHAE